MNLCRSHDFQKCGYGVYSVLLVDHSFWTTACVEAGEF